MYSYIDCKRSYGPPFVWMTDEMWEKLGCQQKDFLCIKCIANRIDNLEDGIWVWHLTAGNGFHDLKRCKTKIYVQ